MYRVLISLGSNLGNRKINLEEALGYLSRFTGINSVSSMYITQPVGGIDQPDFMNAVAEVRTGMLPGCLLSELKRIETEMGRVKAEKWGPRIIDLDILFYGNIIIETENLLIPHPGIEDRRFVLKPLCEILPEFIHPQSQKSIMTLLHALNDDFEVEYAGKLSIISPQ